MIAARATWKALLRRRPPAADASPASAAVSLMTARPQQSCKGRVLPAYCDDGLLPSHPFSSLSSLLSSLAPGRSGTAAGRVSDDAPARRRRQPCRAISGAIPKAYATPPKGTLAESGWSGAALTSASSGRASTPTDSQARGLTSQALLYSHHGPPGEVLRLESLHVPQPGPKEVLVQFLAAPMNPSDINIIEGKYPLRPQLPATPGNEGVAVVLATGPEVSDPLLCPGTHVVPLVAGMGTWRSHAVLPAEGLYPLPDGLEVLPSAAISINPPTALSLLEKFVDLQPGSVVVQNGANSAVGQAVIEIAASRGIKTINVIRKRSNWDEVSSLLTFLGGSVVTTLEQAKEASGHLPRPSLALNCVGGPSATKLAKMLSPGGTMVTYGGMSLQPVTVPTPLLIFKDVRLRGFALSMSTTREDKRRLLDEVVSLMLDKGLFTRQSYKVFDLCDFREALAVCGQQYRDCKVVLRSS